MLALCLLLLILAGCSPLPKYDVQGSVDDGLVINVEGVIYKTEPGVLGLGGDWEPNNLYDTELIGENENDSSARFYVFNGETKRIFIVERFSSPPFSFEKLGDFYFRRTDVQLPAYDTTGINEIGISGEDDKIINISNDRQTIEKMLALLEGPREQIQRANLLGVIYNVLLMNSDYPGISIPLYVEATNDRFIINERVVPQNLLEQIAGKKLPAPSEIAASRSAQASK